VSKYLSFVGLRLLAESASYLVFFSHNKLVNHNAWMASVGASLTVCKVQLTDFLSRFLQILTKDTGRILVYRRHVSLVLTTGVLLNIDHVTEISNNKTLTRLDFTPCLLWPSEYAIESK